MDGRGRGRGQHPLNRRQPDYRGVYAEYVEREAQLERERRQTPPSSPESASSIHTNVSSWTDGEAMDARTTADGRRGTERAYRPGWLPFNPVPHDRPAGSPPVRHVRPPVVAHREMNPLAMGVRALVPGPTVPPRPRIGGLTCRVTGGANAPAHQPAMRVHVHPGRGFPLVRPVAAGRYLVGPPMVRARMHNPLAPGPSAVVGVSRVVMAASSDGRNVATVVQQAAYHMAPVVQIAQAPRVLSPTTAPITRLKVTIGGNNIIDMKRTSERRIMSVLFDNREIVEYLHANNIKVNRKWGSEQWLTEELCWMVRYIMFGENAYYHKFLRSTIMAKSPARYREYFDYLRMKYMEAKAAYGDVLGLSVGWAISYDDWLDRFGNA